MSFAALEALRRMRHSPAHEHAQRCALLALDELHEHRSALAALAAAVERGEPTGEPLAAAQRLLDRPPRVWDARRRTTGVVRTGGAP